MVARAGGRPLSRSKGRIAETKESTPPPVDDFISTAVEDVIPEDVEQDEQNVQEIADLKSIIVKLQQVLLTSKSQHLFSNLVNIISFPKTGIG